MERVWGEWEGFGVCQKWEVRVWACGKGLGCVGIGTCKELYCN